MRPLRSLRRVLRSQKGNALILALGASAVIGAISFEIFRAVEVTQKRSRQAALRDDSEFIMAALESRLQNPESCTAMLGGLPFLPTGQTPVTLNWTYDTSLPNFAGPISAGKEITTGIRVGSITLDPIDLSEFPPTDPASRSDIRTQVRDAAGNLQQYTRYPSRLHVTFEAKDQEAVSINRVRTRSGLDLGLPVLVWVHDGTSRISACFGRNSAGSFCNMNGGYYDATPGVRIELRCRQSVYTQQFIGGVFENRGSCRWAGYTTNQADCPLRFSNPGTPDVYGAVYMQQAFYGLPQGFLCMRCD